MKRWLIECSLFLLPPEKRANFLKKRKIFHSMGNDVFYFPYKIPSEPYLVSIGNNVKIASGVIFITHDICQTVFKTAGFQVQNDCLYYMNTITIGNNVMIGANTILLYGISIGNNVIIAAGSVVTKNISDGLIVGGNPAHVIGSFDELAKKRFLATGNRPTNQSKISDINAYFWKDTIKESKQK